MAPTVACIAGEEIYRQWDTGRISGRQVGSRETPFGPSGEIFLIEADDESFYLLPRYGAGMGKTAPRKINDRANLYALKDMGVQCVLAWGPGGAITHNIAVGDLVILSDVIDRTYLRQKTFFENCPLGFLRQFPVFCPTLRNVAGEVLHSMKLLYHGGGIAAVCEGPRLETPAEIRMLATVGAEVVTHTFVPEVFLARELQLCYAAICYVVNYAETGSRHRPFGAGTLFGGLTQQSDTERLAGTVGAMSQIVRNVAAALKSAEKEGEKKCECDKTMSAHIRQYNLPDDWRRWFE
ncbi:MAG: MTAP family purine nucleoside phosphorylase [Phycisphaerae bacterium]|nr:MTAP family purine nucleoside phosphorylase [Phycisphaerae bacterium]